MGDKKKRKFAKNGGTKGNYATSALFKNLLVRGMIPRHQHQPLLSATEHVQLKVLYICFASILFIKKLVFLPLRGTGNKFGLAQRPLSSGNLRAIDEIMPSHNSTRLHLGFRKHWQSLSGNFF